MTPHSLAQTTRADASSDPTGGFWKFTFFFAPRCRAVKQPKSSMGNEVSRASRRDEICDTDPKCLEFFRRHDVDRIVKNLRNSTSRRINASEHWKTNNPRKRRMATASPRALQKLIELVRESEMSPARRTQVLQALLDVDRDLGHGATESELKTASRRRACNCHTGPDGSRRARIQDRRCVRVGRRVRKAGTLPTRGVDRAPREGDAFRMEAFTDDGHRGCEPTARHGRSLSRLMPASAPDWWSKVVLATHTWWRTPEVTVRMRPVLVAPSDRSFSGRLVGALRLVGTDFLTGSTVQPGDRDVTDVARDRTSIQHGSPLGTLSCICWNSIPRSVDCRPGDAPVGAVRTPVEQRAAPGGRDRHRLGVTAATAATTCCGLPSSFSRTSMRTNPGGSRFPLPTPCTRRSTADGRGRMRRTSSAI